MEGAECQARSMIASRRGPKLSRRRQMKRVEARMAVRLRQRTRVNLTSRIREKPTSRVYLDRRPQAIPPHLECLSSDHSFCRFGKWFEEASDGV